jgi:DNA gyrase subunit B
MFPLVNEGYVYIGQPPLYRLGKGKKEKYFLNEAELNTHLFTVASEKMKIILQNDEDNIIKGKEFVEIMEHLSIYQRIISFMERMNIWEGMVQFLLENSIKTADQFTDESFLENLVEKLPEEELVIGNIRSCRWRPDCYEVDVAVRGKVQIMMTLGPQIPLINEYRTALSIFARIKDYLMSTFKIITVNKSGQEKVIYADNWSELLTAVREESFRGSHLQRYKGLGEMNPEQLWDTTMNPENRKMKQVTIEDAEAADRVFDLLMGSEVAPRKHFIQTHAKTVENLDV